MTSYYLNEQSEAELLAIILMGISTEKPTAAQRDTADQILCGLIERGLSDADGGPGMFQAWVAIDGSHDDDDDLREHLHEEYARVKEEGLF